MLLLTLLRAYCMTMKNTGCTSLAMNPGNNILAMRCWESYLIFVSFKIGLRFKWDNVCQITVTVPDTNWTFNKHLLLMSSAVPLLAKLPREVPWNSSASSGNKEKAQAGGKNEDALMVIGMPSPLSISLGRSKGLFHGWSMRQNNKWKLYLGGLQPSRKKVEIWAAETQLPE